MQAVAAEMNLSETAFAVPTPAGFDLRWFTPTTEVVLCGHATLATAHTLWETNRLEPDREAVFHTRRSGVLVAARAGDTIELSLPSDPPFHAEIPEHVARAIGVPIVAGFTCREGWLLELGSEAEVRALAPDVRALASLRDQAVIVTAAARDTDFVSRYFVPSAGIDEDPVTGAAHCVLAPFWAERLGRNQVVGYQASARGGTVCARVVGDRIHLTGHAVTIMRGDLQVTPDGWNPGSSAR
jgi:PhzF family phenazine biosynthesis protein